MRRRVTRGTPPSPIGHRFAVMPQPCSTPRLSSTSPRFVLKSHGARAHSMCAPSTSASLTHPKSAIRRRAVKPHAHWNICSSSRASLSLALPLTLPTLAHAPTHGCQTCGQRQMFCAGSGSNLAFRRCASQAPRRSSVRQRPRGWTRFSRMLGSSGTSPPAAFVGTLVTTDSPTYA